MTELHTFKSKVLFLASKSQQINLSCVKKSAGTAEKFEEETNLFKKQEFCLYKWKRRTHATVNWALYWTDEEGTKYLHTVDKRTEVWHS